MPFLVCDSSSAIIPFCPSSSLSTFTLFPFLSSSLLPLLPSTLPPFLRSTLPPFYPSSLPSLLPYDCDCVSCACMPGMNLTHEGAAVLSDRDKGIACACRELGINERKCAVHIHANFYLAGFFTRRCRPSYLPLSLSPSFRPLPFSPFPLFPRVPSSLMNSCPFSLFLFFHVSPLPSCPITTSPSFLLSFFPYCPKLQFFIRSGRFFPRAQERFSRTIRGVRKSSQRRAEPIPIAAIA